jgi:type IV pilus assembly protein PilC
MAKFIYRARTADGKLVKGTLRAASEERALVLLRSHNLNPIEVVVGQEASLLNRTIGRGVSPKDLILFFRQASSMISAGVPILQALQALVKQVNKSSFKRVIEDMVYDIEAGESLSISMSKHDTVFSPFTIGVVRTGEASGRLSASLAAIGDHLEQDYNFTRRVRAAMIYPVFLLTVVIILALLMFTFVLPQLVALFADAGVTLPWPTRVLISVTTFFSRYWLLLAALGVVLGLLLRSYLKTPEGRYNLSTAVLRLPIIRRLFQKIYLARVTSVLHTLFTSDVPALESFELAKEAVGNRVFQRIMDDTIKAIKDGASISFVWQHEPNIPPMLTTMVAVGEKSGEVGLAFNQASTFFRRDVDSILDSIAVLLEPIMILILGVGVGIVVGAILLPIYNLVLVL